MSFFNQKRWRYDAFSGLLESTLYTIYNHVDPYELVVLVLSQFWTDELWINSMYLLKYMRNDNHSFPLYSTLFHFIPLQKKTYLATFLGYFNMFFVLFLGRRTRLCHLNYTNRKIIKFFCKRLFYLILPKLKSKIPHTSVSGIYDFICP